MCQENGLEVIMTEEKEINVKREFSKFVETEESNSKLKRNKN